MKDKNKDNMDWAFEGIPFKRLKDSLNQSLSDILNQIDEADDGAYERIDLLECTDCGAYEEEVFGNTKKVFSEDDKPTKYDQFIIVDVDEESEEFFKGVKYNISYSYICPLCGSWQEVEVEDVVYDEEI